jgi:hypothetical protein
MGGSSRSCHDAAEALKNCLRQTDCFKSGKFTLRECVSQTTECKDVHYAFTTCMRSQLDMRGRIQGFKAADGDSGM